MDYWWFITDEWYFHSLLNLLTSFLSHLISFPFCCLFFSLSVRPSSGWFCPHALCLHAQHTAVPSTHGTISFSALSLQCSPFNSYCLYPIPIYQISTQIDTLITVARLLCWQTLSELDRRICSLLHTLTVLLTASWTARRTGSAYGSAEAAVVCPALMNAQLPSHHSNKL